MIDRRRLLAALALCLTAGALLAAGCGGDDDDAGAGSTADPAAPAALPIEERVIDDGLGGLSGGRPVEVAGTPEEFATLVDDAAGGRRSRPHRRGFTDGPFVYVEIAGGTTQAVDPQVALVEARALYERVKGSPAP